MPCYNPLLRIEDKFVKETAKDGHKYNKARIISTKYIEADQLKDTERYTKILIPCGNCIGCRLDYSREWANRGFLEAQETKNKNYFVTLTLEDGYVEIPEEVTTKNNITFCEEDSEFEWQGTLIPKDIVKFMKALRQEFATKYNHKGIRFMAAGEYGSQTQRPHYHLILFNCPFPPETFYDSKVNWEKDVSWKNTILDKIWKKGFSEITEATWNTIAYVSRYITKKINGDYSEEEYASRGQIKEFFRTSRNPGIARNYYEKNKEKIYEHDKILIINKKGSHWVQPPAYFDRLLKKEDPTRFEEIQEKRKKELLDQLLIKDKTTSLDRWEQLQIEKATKEAAGSTLKRIL